MKTATLSSLKKKALVPTELQECRTLVDYLDAQQRLGNVLLYTHIANETYTTSWSAKKKNKILGVRKGFPDYCVITQKGVYFIEMKRVVGGVVSPEQNDWIELLNHFGKQAKVCKGAGEAIDFLEKGV